MRRRPPPTVLRSGAARPRRLVELVALPRRSPLFPELARALAAADALHVLETNLLPTPVRVTATTRRGGCYRLREGDPVDLRVSSRHDRVALSFLHELGHLLDHQLAPAPRSFASPRLALFAPWRAAAGSIEQRAPAFASRGHRRYFSSWRELWARSYAQWVVLRSGDSALGAGLAAAQAADDRLVWPAAHFEPVAIELDALFSALGLARASELAA